MYQKTLFKKGRISELLDVNMLIDEKEISERNDKKYKN